MASWRIWNQRQHSFGRYHIIALKSAILYLLAGDLNIVPPRILMQEVNLHSQAQTVQKVIKRSVPNLLISAIFCLKGSRYHHHLSELCPMAASHYLFTTYSLHTKAYDVILFPPLFLTAETELHYTIYIKLGKHIQVATRRVAPQHIQIKQFQNFISLRLLSSSIP